MNMYILHFRRNFLRYTPNDRIYNEQNAQVNVSIDQKPFGSKSLFSLFLLLSSFDLFTDLSWSYRFA